MGADEKHAATCHGGEYTPATENVEHSYVAYRSSKVDLITGHHEFTRWLETVRAEAKAEALEEAADALTREEVPDGWGIPTYENYGNWLRARANQYKENQS